MIQFSNCDERITKLFAIIFWILVGFHIIFGCIGELINFTINWLGSYEIVDIPSYVMASIHWVIVS